MQPLHGFLYSIDQCTQSFKIVYYKTWVNVWWPLVSWCKNIPCKDEGLSLQAQNQTYGWSKTLLNIWEKLPNFYWFMFNFGTQIWTCMILFKQTITLLFALSPPRLSFVSSVYVAQALWTSVHRWLGGCCCHLLMSPVMMWGWFFLETASRSQNSIIPFKQNKVRQRQLWTSREREAASLSSANHSANTFEVVTCLWKMLREAPVFFSGWKGSQLLVNFWPLYGRDQLGFGPAAAPDSAAVFDKRQWEFSPTLLDWAELREKKGKVNWVKMNSDEPN